MALGAGKGGIAECARPGLGLIRPDFLSPYYDITSAQRLWHGDTYERLG